MKLFGFVLLAASACYQPTTAVECTLTCNSPSDCPDELQCNADNLCSKEGAACDVVAPDAPSTGFCAGDKDGLLGTVCFLEMPLASALPNGPNMIFTGADPRCLDHPRAPGACLIVVSSIDDDIRAVGEKPLVLWTLEDLVIAHDLDVSSRGIVDSGAGGSTAPCLDNPGIGGLDTTLGAGGAGGTFGAQGGVGGECNGMNNGGVPAQVETSSSVRGGCSGSRGGDATGALQESTGGRGGGAVYLIAGKGITVTAAGTINASGGGGLNPGNRVGGGGGGSGGLIGLDAATVAIAGVVIALGGGGSGGGNNASDGLPGAIPTTIAPHRAPRTLSLGSCAGFGPGGAGSDGIDGVENGQPGMSSCGGGGGGGGDGVIRVFGDRTGVGTVLPTAQ